VTLGGWKSIQGKPKLFFLKPHSFFLLMVLTKDGNPILKINSNPVKIIIPTPGTLSNPNPKESIPKINIEITTFTP